MSEQTQSPGLLTYAQAAAKLGIGIRTLKAWVKARRIRAIRLSPGAVRFRESDLELFISRKATISY